MELPDVDSRHLTLQAANCRDLAEEFEMAERSESGPERNGKIDRGGTAFGTPARLLRSSSTEGD
jgi:hypothetical protein